MKSLCKLAGEAASYTADWMRRQPSVKEESITDWLLYFLDQSPSIRYYQFTHHGEARSGADWDWWFLMQKGCFKIRVQAKKIKKNYNHYSDLAYQNKTGYQLCALLNSSANYNFYPIYSLYGLSENVERCPILSDQALSNQSCLFICSAQKVYDLVFGSPQNRIESSDLLKLSIPLPCLFCCSLASDIFSDGPLGLFQRYPLKTLFTIDTDDEEKYQDRRGYENEVPSIIRTLFEVRESTDETRTKKTIGDPQDILSQYQREFVGTNGVAIVQIE